MAGYSLEVWVSHTRILAIIGAALINRNLAKIGGVLILDCVFPQSYTKFESQARIKQRDALIIEGALMTAILRYNVVPVKMLAHPGQS